jgi:hypothetical protein
VSKLLGIVGILVVCAGLDLLWQSRREIKFWVLAYISVFRALLRQPDSPMRNFPAQQSPEKRRHAVRVALGMGLVFFLGPMLIALSLTLMLYHDL